MLSNTKISKGSKHTITDKIVSMMAKQLKLGGAGNLVKLVGCTIDKDECLQIIRTNSGISSAATASKPAPASDIRTSQTEKRKFR